MLPTITVIGNLNKIETKFTQNGKQVTKFKVECAEKNKKGEWINLYLDGEVWDKSAEFVNQYFKDGSVAIVTGKLYTNVYEKQDGSKVYQNKLLFPNVSFAPKEKNKDNQSNNSQANYQQPQQQQAQQYQAPQPQYQNQQGQRVTQQQYNQNQQQAQVPPAIDVDEDEIPF